MTAAMRGPMQAVPPLQRADGSPLLDGAPRHYLGVSMGHIMGGTLAALTPTSIASAFTSAPRASVSS
jgi:hypothetical protein